MGKVGKWVGIAFGVSVALGVGVTIGWFSKPAEETTVTNEDGFDFKLIDEFTNAVDTAFLEKESEHLAGKIRWATSKGDYEMADYIINKWKDQLDD